MPDPNEQLQAPAGWYPDPQTPTLQRWWDGSAWTAHTEPRTPPPGPQPTGRGSLYNGKQDVAAGKNTAAQQALWAAIASFVAALVGGGWVLLASVVAGIAAVVWGSIGMNRANLTGKGRALATIALALGVVGLLVAIFRLMAL